MAIELPLFKPGVFSATADLSAAQFTAVKLDTTNPLQVVAAAAGNLALGVLQNKPIAGEAAEVMTEGISKCVYGGTVAVGDRLAVGTGGKLVVATAGAWIVGQALLAGVANDIGSVKIDALGLEA